MEGYGGSINDFEFVSNNKLGSGAFGEVFEAKCLDDGVKGRKVAIKKISKKSSVDEQKIKREIKLHSELQDDSIVKLYTSFEDDDYWYLVMELCDGGSLEKYLEKKKKLPEVEACHIIKQVIDAIYGLHACHKIIHRDLSLRNILLKTERGEKYYQVKIADFGLACKLKNGKISERVGTLDFMAPEVYRKQPYDFKSDWWSIGCILFALLYGHPPFKQKKKKEINYRALNSIFPSEASEEAKELLTALLEENPDKRSGITNRALNYNFFKKYEDVLQLSGDSGLNLDSTDEPLILELNKRTPKNDNNYSNYNSSHGEFRKRSYNKESLVDKYNDLKYTKPKVLSDTLVRSNSRRILSSEQSKRNKSDFGSTYKSKVEALPSQNESYDEISKQTDLCRRRVRSSKSTNYQGSNFSEHERRENSVLVNEFKPKVQISTSSKTSYDGSLSKQMLYDNKYHMNQSNLRHKLHDSDNLYMFESQYDPSIRTLPERSPYPSERQNISEQSWKANSHDSDSGHCASNENMHFPITHQFQGNVQINSSHIYNKRYNPEVENEQEICRKNKALDRISTARLRNMRKKLNNFVCSVFDNDDGSKQVCLEVFKKSEEKELLLCALFISHDSKEIMVFKPKKTIMVSDKPPSVNLKTKKSKREVEYFSLENLPEKYWKRYQCAKLFVDTIKAQTPKVIFYKEFGKCIMMENTPNPDFEMHFYDGYKVTESKGKITIRDEIGNVVTKKGNHEDILNNFEQMKNACRLTEQFHETLGVFPVVVGRSNGKLKKQDSNKENSSPRTMQSSLMSGGSALKSFDITLNTDSSASQFSCLKSRSTVLSSEQSNISLSRMIKSMANLEPGQVEKVQNYIQNMNMRSNN